MFERATWDWDASPSLLVYGPEDNLAERRWAAWAARPSPDRLVEAALDEDRVRELRAAGKSVRAIAGELGLSKSQVARIVGRAA